MTMAQQFKIFIDCPEEKAGADQVPPLKREPLALRQHLTLRAATTNSNALQAQQQQHQQQQQALSQSQSPSSSPSPPHQTSSATVSLSINDEDQENDISMASLGSDFVPSILHDHEFDNEHSFEVEEEEEEQVSTNSLVDDFDDDDFDEEDEELRLELNEAFRQHDDSQLFKSVVYIDDIHTYLLELERCSDIRPLANYMDFQKDIDTDKRAILINWLVEVSDEYDLQTETLFICIDLIDRFLSKMSIPTSNFQLLGVAAMFIASKYEEIYPPSLFQFVEITDDTYSGKQICQMEQEILKALNFRISTPTISFFLREIFAFNKFSKKVFHLAEYLCHLALLNDQPFLGYYPSEIALAAVILAANQLDMAANITSDLKIAYDKSNVDQMRRQANKKNKIPFCIESLRTSQERAYSRATRLSTDSSTVHKFSSSSLDCVTTLKPPSVEDLHSY